MSDTFVLQGMDKFSFDISEPYSAPHSLLFALILARDVALKTAKSGNDPLFSDENEFRSVAKEIQQQYLFSFSSGNREAVFELVRAYLDQHPDERVEKAIEFASLPENQPSIEEFHSNVGFSLPPKKIVKNEAAKKHKKKMAAQSKRRNRK